MIIVTSSFSKSYVLKPRLRDGLERTEDLNGEKAAFYMKSPRRSVG